MFRPVGMRQETKTCGNPIKVGLPAAGTLHATIQRQVVNRPGDEAAVLERLG